MTMIKWFAPLILLAAVGPVFGQNAPKPSADDLAKLLVSKVARVKDGDIVQITGTARDIELLESLSVECAKIGADTLITLNPTDKTARRLVLDVAEKFDSRLSRLNMKVAETVTVMFAFDPILDGEATKGIPPGRLQARSAASQPVVDKTIVRGVRRVFLGNGLYPTDARAKELGLSRDVLASLYYAGLAVNYDALVKTAREVKAKLAGKELKLTSPHGTELTLGLEKQVVLVSDGVISDDMVKAGGAACAVYLPAGEVYVRPVLGTASGRVVIPHSTLDGLEISDVSLTFEKGKLKAMTAKPGPGFDRLEASYKAAGAGKDQFAFIDIGVNSALRIPATAKGGVWSAAGMVTVGFGGDTWAGGDNKCPFAFNGFLRDASLTVDGKALVKAGELVK